MSAAELYIDVDTAALREGVRLLEDVERLNRAPLAIRWLLGPPMALVANQAAAGVRATDADRPGIGFTVTRSLRVLAWLGRRVGRS